MNLGKSMGVMLHIIGKKVLQQYQMQHLCDVISFCCWIISI